MCIIGASGALYRGMSIHYCGVPCEKWSSARPCGAAAAPFGQLPVLRANGVTLAQSGTIIHLLADIAGRVPKP